MELMFRSAVDECATVRKKDENRNRSKKVEVRTTFESLEIPVVEII
jgi:hypothetical protein